MIRVDAHHHVWRLSRGDYAWITPDLPIHRDYTLDDLRPLLGNITATVLVQAAPTEAETDYLLDVAQNSSGLVRGVVGWTDFTSNDAPTRIATLATAPLLKGLRPMLQDITDTDWILRADVQRALHAAVAAGLCFDALVQSRHLPILLEVCTRQPNLRLVIDHGAKPGIANRDWQPWANDIRRLARETSVLCKLSGLVTEAASNWRAEDLCQYIDHLLDCFGADRLMWGSDWPVVNLAGGYMRWREVSLTLLAGLSVAEQDAILGGAAVKFYGLTAGMPPNI